MSSSQTRKPQNTKTEEDKPYSTCDTEPNVDFHYLLQMDNVIITSPIAGFYWLGYNIANHQQEKPLDNKFDRHLSGLLGALWNP